MDIDREIRVTVFRLKSFVDLLTDEAKENLRKDIKKIKGEWTLEYPNKPEYCIHEAAAFVDLSAKRHYTGCRLCGKEL